MKKKIFIACSITVLIIAIPIFRIIYILNFTPIGNYYKKDFAPIKGQLYVHGVQIVDENVELCHNGSVNFSRLPLIKTMKAYGCKVEWMNEDIARITFNDKCYILDLVKTELIEEGDSYNWISPSLGTTIFYSKRIEKDIVLDSNTIFYIFDAMGERIAIDIDRDRSVVSIEKRDT